MQRTTASPTWRVAEPADETLLLDLFVEDKVAEFAPLGLPFPQVEALAAMQFRARQAGYAQQFPNSVDIILCLADGTAVGRHLIEREVEVYRGLDLAILPEFRNQGIGTWALKQVQQLAAAEGVAFQLRVLRTNRARALYERLGFLPVRSDEVFIELAWSADTTRLAKLCPVNATPYPANEIACSAQAGIHEQRLVAN